MNKESLLPVSSIDTSWPADISLIFNDVPGIGVDAVVCDPHCIITPDMLHHSFPGFGVVREIAVEMSMSPSDIPKMTVTIKCLETPNFGWWQEAGGPEIESYEDTLKVDNNSIAWHTVVMSGPMSRFGAGFTKRS